MQCKCTNVQLILKTNNKNTLIIKGAFRILLKGEISLIFDTLMIGEIYEEAYFEGF